MAQASVIELYPEGIPCGNDRETTTEFKADIGVIVIDVHRPELHHYAPVPRASSRRAIVVIPGGGYWIEAWDLEGVDVARRLTAAGHHVFLLRHRLPGRETVACRATAALDDARRAVQTVRSLADSLGFRSDGVGIMGFSAGGHLAGSASVHPIAAATAAAGPVAHSSRPDFAVLVYPVIRMGPAAPGHSGSQRALLGENPDSAQLTFYDLPRHVTAATPPTILFHASDDTGVSPLNSVAYYSALIAAGVPASLHVYATGGHGFGSGAQLDGPVAGWLPELLRWLRHLDQGDRPILVPTERNR